MSVRAAASPFLPSAPIQQNFTDATDTPGDVAINTPRGRVAFAALTSAVTVTHPDVAESSPVFAQLTDPAGALTQAVNVAITAGSFTINGNATTVAGGGAVDFLVVN